MTFHMLGFVYTRTTNSNVALSTLLKFFIDLPFFQFS
jgi:hypothetical protein